MVKMLEETRKKRGCEGCFFDKKDGCDFRSILRVNGMGKCLKKRPKKL